MPFNTLQSGALRMAMRAVWLEWKYLCEQAARIILATAALHCIFTEWDRFIFRTLRSKKRICSGFRQEKGALRRLVFPVQGQLQAQQ